MAPRDRLSNEELASGRRCCPVCSEAVQVGLPAIRFFFRNEGDALYFMLCDGCAANYDSYDREDRIVLQQACFERVKNSGEFQNLYACTSYLALTMNFGDFRAAVEYGLHGIDRELYDLIVRSDEAIFSVNGMPIFWRRLTFPSTPDNAPPVVIPAHPQPIN
jgi:hypothetical protein